MERTTVLLLAGGVASAAVAGYMVWRSLAAAGQQPMLPVAERKQKLAHVEQVFLKKFPKVPSMTAVQAQQLLQQQPDKYIIVDVRNMDEQKVSMLPGSRVVTQQEFEQQRNAFKNTTAICYCTVGYRSGLYARGLMDQGLQAANLQGGILAWTQAALPLVDGVDRQQPSSSVHTYAARWAFHGDGYTPVYYKNAYTRMLKDQLGKLTARVFGHQHRG